MGVQKSFRKSEPVSQLNTVSHSKLMYILMWFGNINLLEEVSSWLLDFGTKMHTVFSVQSSYCVHFSFFFIHILSIFSDCCNFSYQLSSFYLCICHSTFFVSHIDMPVTSAYVCLFNYFNVTLNNW